MLATGLGKTVVMAEVVADLLRDDRITGGRVLVLAHTRALVDQLHRSFWYQLPTWISTHQLNEGELPSYWDGITFATVQSALAKLDQFPQFGLVLVDEAHHIGADTFQQVIQSLEPPMLGGVTATPWRGDGFDLNELLGPPLVRIGIADGLREGFLSEVDYRLLADNLNWEVVQDLSKHRYSLSELNKKLIIPTRDEEAARIVREVFVEERRRGGIVFSPTIVHAEAFAAMLRRYGFRSEAISSETDPRNRDTLMSRFRAGHMDIVTTVDLFNEGVDVPDVDILVFLRADPQPADLRAAARQWVAGQSRQNKVVVLDFVTDLRRIAEVVELDGAARGGDIESSVWDRASSSFTTRPPEALCANGCWTKPRCCYGREIRSLRLPRLDFPRPPTSGAVQ